jgi:hypothetical protein
VPSRPRTIGVLAVALGLSAWALAPPAAAQPTEDEVKAALLYNFTRFVDWPAGAFPERDAPFVFCLLGDPSFGVEVGAAVAAKRRDGRPIELRQASELSELDDCHLLFVGRSERARLAEILAALRQLPVLTVGDSDEFVGGGGMIGLVLRRNRVRFEIDHAAAERVGLAISSRLLDLAERVVPSRRVAGRR